MSFPAVKAELFFLDSPFNFPSFSFIDLTPPFEPICLSCVVADGPLSSSVSFLVGVMVVVGTFGVLTGSIGELVLDRLPKNRIGFSGLGFESVCASNFARPFATAPINI